MPIRGQRSIYPKPKSPPTGMFSSKGKQKNDSTADLPAKSLKEYAHGHSPKNPKMGSKKNGPTNSLRHQKPKRQY